MTAPRGRIAALLVHIEFRRRPLWIAVTRLGCLNHRKSPPMIKTLAAAAVLSLGLAGYAVAQEAAPAPAPMAEPMHHHHHHHYVHHHHHHHHHMHHMAPEAAPAPAPAQ